MKSLSCWFITAWCVFFYQSVYFFTNSVFQDFHHNIMFLWFLENSDLAKGVVWFSPPKCHIFTLAFKYFTYTIEAPLSLRTSCKKCWGCCPQAPTRAYLSWTLRTRVLKNDLPANLFLLCVISQKCNEFTLAFKYVLYKHTFWLVFRILRHV